MPMDSCLLRDAAEAVVAEVVVEVAEAEEAEVITEAVRDDQIMMATLNGDVQTTQIDPQQMQLLKVQRDSNADLDLTEVEEAVVGVAAKDEAAGVEVQDLVNRSLPLASAHPPSSEGFTVSHGNIAQ